MNIIGKSAAFWLFLIITVFTAGASILWGAPAPTSSAGEGSEEIRGAVTDLLKTLRSDDAPQAPIHPTTTKEPVRIDRTAEGFIRNLGAPPLKYFPVGTVVPDKPEETARNFLRENGRLFGVKSEAVDFTLHKNKSKGNRRYVRFHQTHSGLEVLGAEAIVLLNPLGGVTYVSSDLSRDTRALDDGTLSTVPTLSADDARERVQGSLMQQAGAVDLEMTTPRLMIFDPSVLGAPGGTRLVWEMKVRSKNDSIAERILLDAHSGEIIRRYPLKIAALNREIYDAYDSANDPGWLRWQEGEPIPDVWYLKDTIDYLADTYNFYLNHHGRDSIDDDGMILSATVRSCKTNDVCPMNDAFYYDNRIYLGSGNAIDDVIGHEYTHGVTQHESELIYENHSGAISESFSDAWGEFIDLSNGRGTDTDAVRWLIAEDEPSAGACRSMSNPPLYFDAPDRLHYPTFRPPESTPNIDNDYGWVHLNAQVNNKLCFLLTDGQTFNGQTVAGMGIDRVAALYYEVQCHLLSSGADYIDLYYALSQAAVNLGWTDGERNNLYRACQAVEIVPATSAWFVDSHADCSMADGTNYFPYCRVVDGLAVAFPGDTLAVRTGVYFERPYFDKVMTIIPIDGPVWIMGQ